MLKLSRQERTFTPVFNKFSIMSSVQHLGRGSQKPVLPDDGKLRLYLMRFCPFAHRARLVLAAKKIPFHAVYINLTEKPEWFTEVSALGNVPALEVNAADRNKTLIESLIICDYLDEKYQENSLYPKDPLQKALDKIWIERFSAVTNAMFKIIFEGLEKNPGGLDEISSGLDILEKELKRRGTLFLSGEKPGMLDYMIWPTFERIDIISFIVGDRFKLDEEKFANLIHWKKTMLNDESVKQFFVDPKDHHKFLKTRRTSNPLYDMLA